MRNRAVLLPICLASMLVLAVTATLVRRASRTSLRASQFTGAQGESGSALPGVEWEATDQDVSLPAREARRGGGGRASPNGKEAAPAADSSDAGSITKVRLEGILDTFYGQSPDIDGLQLACGELSSLAEVDRESIIVDERTGEVRGSIEIGAVGMSGTFTIDGESVRVEFPSSFSSREYFLRDLTLNMRADPASMRGGEISVQHHLDVRNPELLSGLGSAERVVGWNVSTSIEAGTVGTPIMARKAPSGNGLIVGTWESETIPIVQQQWDWNISRYDGWRVLLSEWMK